MSGRYLLDTNIVVAPFNGDTALEARFDDAPEVFLPSVVLGELHFGAANSARSEANAARIDDFAASCTVTGVGAETARRYGALKARLGRQGRPNPENDIWIVACAFQHDLILTTRDSHFDQVEGLQIEAW